jgi:UDP-N-acetylmuramate dehydrogenase
MNFDSRIQTGVSLHAYSTIRIGGKAANFLSVRSSEEVNEALSWVNENKVPLFILGSGSNTLFSDLGFSGLVLHNELKGIEWKETEGQVAARVASGENWDDFVLACIGKGLTGFEAMSGIPGQVGSTPIQNVGAYGQEVCAHIESVEVIECESGDRITIPKEDCRFGYRTSRFKSDDRGKYFVTAVNFLLPKDKQPKILYQELFHYVKQNLRYKNLQTIPEKLTAIQKKVHGSTPRR